MTFGYKINAVIADKNDSIFWGSIKIKLIHSENKIVHFTLQSKEPLEPLIKPGQILNIAPIIKDIGNIEFIKVIPSPLNNQSQIYIKHIDVIRKKTGQLHHFPCHSWIENSSKIISNSRKTKKRIPQFKIFKGKDKKYYFHLKAMNGEIIAASEGYNNKAGALNGIDAIKTAAPVAGILQT